MNVFEPVRKPRITIPSVVSLPFLNVFKHSVNMLFAVVGKYGFGEELFVDVKFLLLSSRKRRHMLLASFLNSLQ